jgi:hypothetical protein
MATLALKQCVHAYETGGGAPEFDETLTTGTIQSGDLLVRINNVANVCGADPAAISYLSTATDADVLPGATATTLALAKIKSSGVFEMSLFHSTPASAVLSDADIDDVLQYGIAKQTVSGVTAWVIDKEETSSKRVTIVKRLSSATDVYPRVLVQFMAASLTFA